MRDFKEDSASFKPLRILQVSGADARGGANKVCWDLFRSYRNMGHLSRMAVGTKLTSDSDVREIPRTELETSWARSLRWMADSLQPVEEKIQRGVGPLRVWLHEMSGPAHILNRWQGTEDFDYPGSWKLLELWPDPPDIIHCHTLHGGYFDLRVLPWLSNRFPLVLTLHDAWYLSGHCAHSLNCERWRTGCGNCPDLTLYPAVERDATAPNWQRKREIYRKSQIYVAVPSRWMLRKAEQSILAEGAVEIRVIPNGVDLSIFKPGDKQQARKRLGLPLEPKILLFVALWGRSHHYKDFRTMQAAAANVADHFDRSQVLFLTVGEQARSESIGRAELHFIAPQDPSTLALYYQAADVYVQASTAETFSIATAEALACGTPAVVTAVGGIPEIVEEGHTGFLVPLGDAEAMGNRIVELLGDEGKQRWMGRTGAEIARNRFGLDLQVKAYLDWYSEILESWEGGPSPILVGAGLHEDGRRTQGSGWKTRESRGKT